MKKRYEVRLTIEIKDVSLLEETETGYNLYFIIKDDKDVKKINKALEILSHNFKHLFCSLAHRWTFGSEEDAEKARKIILSFPGVQSHTP